MELILDTVAVASIVDNPTPETSALEQYMMETMQAQLQQMDGFASSSTEG